MQNREALRVAVCGLGHVGGETASLLWKERARFAKTAGRPVVLAAVCDRRAGAKARALGLPASVQRLGDWRQAAAAKDIDAVIELFGGVGDAARLVERSLAAGKHVITGNKHLLSTRWNQVFSAARKNGRTVGFEAAVAGAVPIVSGLRTGLAANDIRSIVGIFNGTTNYILSRMAHEGCGLKTALAEAQRLGMAERVPTMDLNGADTAHKISILASLIAGAWVRPDGVRREGIESVEADDIGFAVEKLGRTVRLLGTAAVRGKNSVEAHVQPTLVPLKHPLAAVHGGYNAALVEGSSAGDLMFYGLGAGPGPAASAVLADVLALARGTEPEPPGSSGNAAKADESPAAFYLKVLVDDKPGRLAAIAGLLGRENISISEIYQDSAKKNGKAVVRIVTHAAERAAVEKARGAVAALSSVAARPKALRLLP